MSASRTAPARVLRLAVGALGLVGAITLAGCTASGGPNGGPASGATSPGEPSAVGVLKQVYNVKGTPGAAFFSPDGNIVCQIGAPGAGAKVGAVRCDIARAGYRVPSAPPSCHGSYGLDFELSRRATLGCVTDTIAPEALLQKVPKGSPNYTHWFDRTHNPQVHLGGQAAAGAGLGYGNAIVLGPVRCVSEQSGVTCSNTATGKGFTISRTAYRIF